MRTVELALVAVLALNLATIPASADYGPYGDDDWPIAVDGTSTNPFLNAPPVNEILGLTVYPYWPVLTLEMERLATEHPDLVKLHSAGKSTAGLDLWMLEIADFGNPEMVPLESREVVWVDGGTHSNEYSGVYFVAHLASFLLDEYETNDTARWIVENRHTWIMPMVNPDGSHLFGRLNAKLVNINRNYPVDWGDIEETPVINNPGPAPASEVETQINIEWFNKTQPDYYASVHCCGNLWLYPYGVQGLDPLDNATLARICEEAFPTVVDDCGPIWSTIYPASGSSVDTVYEYTGAAAFGYEMSGRGAAALWGQPFTDAAVREQEHESWTGVLHAFLNVERYGAYPVIESIAPVPGGLEVVVRNDGYGILPGAVASLWMGDAPVPELGALSESIAPGESGTILVGWNPLPGKGELVLSYDKRIQSSPQGRFVLPLSVLEGPDGLHVELLDASGIDTPALPLGDETTVPGPGFVILLSAIAIAGVALRRRG